jgi:hypothetical protein
VAESATDAASAASGDKPFGVRRLGRRSSSGSKRSRATSSLDSSGDAAAAAPEEVYKVAVGMHEKTFRGTESSHAFNNCMVLVLRVPLDGDGEVIPPPAGEACWRFHRWHEFHVKIFNTGDIDVPGIKSEAMYRAVSGRVVALLGRVGADADLATRTVLTNSDFKCGFEINRAALHDVLRARYDVDCTYDPCCGHPGVTCKFLYDDALPPEAQTTSRRGPGSPASAPATARTLTVMIFRTGSILINGGGDRAVFTTLHEMILAILTLERDKIAA